MAPGVVPIQLKAVRETMGAVQHESIVACVHVWEWKEDTVEPIVSGCARGQAGGVRGTTRVSVRSGVLKLVLQTVKGIPRNEPVQVNSAHQLSASAPLIANLQHEVFEGFH